MGDVGRLDTSIVVWVVNIGESWKGNTRNNRWVIIWFICGWVDIWLGLGVDEFIMLLLSSVGGMAMCGAVDRRVNDVVVFSYQFRWWCILHALPHCGALLNNGSQLNHPLLTMGMACAQCILDLKSWRAGAERSLCQHYGGPPWRSWYDGILYERVLGDWRLVTEKSATPTKKISTSYL